MFSSKPLPPQTAGFRGRSQVLTTQETRQDWARKSPHLKTFEKVPRYSLSKYWFYLYIRTRLMSKTDPDFSRNFKDYDDMYNNSKVGFPGAISGKGPACQCRRPKRHGFNPWVEKIPWRRAWQLTLVLLPREFHEQRVCGLQSMGSQTVRYDWSDLLHTYNNKSCCCLVTKSGPTFATPWTITW